MSQLPPYIWQFRGEDQDGPNVIVLGGTHGDEITGAQLVRDWLEVIDPRGGHLRSESSVIDMPGVSGNLFLGFGNPEAMLRNTRSASQERDLNRCFEPALLDGTEDWVDLRRARELWPFFRETDFLVDIHAVGQLDEEPFVCFGEMTEMHRAICRKVPVLRIVTDPDCFLGRPEGSNVLTTTDQAVNGYGGSDWSVRRYGSKQGIGLCYETGYQTDETKLPLAKLVIARVLRDVGVIDDALLGRLEPRTDEEGDNARKTMADFDPSSQRILKLVAYGPVFSEKDITGFKHEPNMTQNWTPVLAGEVFGRYSDGTEILIPKNGVLIFPQPAKKFVMKKSAFFVGQ